jgi:outer membrane protein assembly factor BamB
LLLGFLLGGTVGGVMLGGLLDRSPTWSLRAALPGPVHAVGSHGDTLLVAAGEAGLYRVGPGTDEVTHLFTPRKARATDVLVADGKAYVLAHNESARQYDLHAIDADSGEFIRSRALGSSVKDLPGLLAKRKLVVVEGAQVRIINRDTSQIYDRVVVTGGILGAAHLGRERLYVSRRFEGGLAIIDITKPELIEVIETEQWLVDVAAAHGKAYVTTRKDGLAVIDLETKSFTPIEASDVLVTRQGNVFALEAESLRELDPLSGPGRRVPLPKSLQAELIGAGAFLVSVEDGHALIACGNRVLALDWPVKETEPDRVARAQ